MRSRSTIARFCALALLALTLLALPSLARAIPGDVSVMRGQVWVDVLRGYDASGTPVYGVPYSQSRYAYEDGSLVPTGTAGASTKGYRTDCSGFVSLAWRLRDSYGRPYSTSTWEMANRTSTYRQITKADLRVGDALLKSTKWAPGGGHVVLFAGWTDATQTSYYALEQVGSGRGTISRINPYPYRGTDAVYYRPYRYVGIEDSFSDVQIKVMGANRYDTAAAAAEVSFPETPAVTVPALVVASGENWPDALGGSALAGVSGGPLLLTAKESLPVSVARSIARLQPKRIYVLGGTGSVSASVERSLASTSTTVIRLGGATRYEVAALVARTAVTAARAKGETVDTAYLATGATFPDALAASPIATRTHRPVLLTTGAALSPEAAHAITELGLKKVVILGGTGSVSPAVATALQKLGVTVTRLDGANRYATALNIAHHGVSLGVGLSWKGLGVASGTAFADALAGGVAQGQIGSVLVLTPATALDPSLAAEAAQHEAEIGQAHVYGGMATITQATRASLAKILRVTQ